MTKTSTDIESNIKRCMSCAYLMPNPEDMLTYCTLMHTKKYVHPISMACDKWSDVTKRALPIKCRGCGKDGVMIGKNTLPDGWGNLLGSDRHYCPDCYARTARVIDREIVNRKPDKTRTITRSVESFFNECFRM